ncbi:MAG: RluA family pseudouridine synthase [Rhodothermales bacterium]|nr:RluA family pseudouridine synthase [Rhodothermales bacterium]MBO6780229.1 RluA family pseudouridine synthase [Rhodothermales bacterium]
MTDPNYPERIDTEVTLEVPPGYREEGRLDLYVTRFLQNVSRSKAQKGIKEGRVTVNGKVIKKVSHPVQPGDRIVCTLLKPPPLEIVPEAIPLDVPFEDEHLLVVNKPPGMVVHPAFGHRTGTLVHALLHHLGAGTVSFEEEEEEPETDDVGLSMMNAGPRFDGDAALRPGIVHRLDKDTSGLLVVAKNEGVHAALAKQFEQRTTRRRYKALVWGTPDPEEGRIEGALARHPRDRKKMAVVREDRGKFAATNYRVEERFQYVSLVSFVLETGRTHQIRVHAKSLGHPVLGDGTYGGAGVARGPDTARRRAYYRNLYDLLPRQALHAETLGFRHPVSREEMDLQSPIPADMAAAMEKLRKGEPG